MAHAINADHDAPLQLGIAFQKTLRVIGQRADQRDGQKHIDWNENGKQVEELVADQRVLQRQHDKKRQHQTAVVAAPGYRQGHEFTQRKQGHQAKQNQRHPVAGQPADPEHQHHEPAGSQQSFHVVEFGALLLGPVAVTKFTHGQQYRDDAGQQQQTENNREQGTNLLVDIELLE